MTTLPFPPGNPPAHAKPPAAAPARRGPGRGRLRAAGLGPDHPGRLRADDHVPAPRPGLGRRNHPLHPGLRQRRGPRWRHGGLADHHDRRRRRPGRGDRGRAAGPGAGRPTGHHRHQRVIPGHLCTTPAAPGPGQVQARSWASTQTRPTRRRPLGTRRRTCRTATVPRSARRTVNPDCAATPTQSSSSSSDHIGGYSTSNSRRPVTECDV